jgi:SM-20-related protein
MKLVLQRPEVREIKVKLILAGGQAAMVALPPEHPLLAQLLSAVAAQAGGEAAAPPAVFQIPIEGGRASLTFSSRQLVAVVTDPAVFVQLDAGDIPATASPSQSLVGVEAAVPAAPRIVRHPAVQLDGFLGADEFAWLRDTVFAAQDRFVSSWVNDNNKDYRQSLVLDAPPAVEGLIVGKIRTAMPEVIAQLKMKAFAVGRIECQVTASADGSYFRVHTDSGTSEDVAKRELTYVYYFNREPKGFTGGELRIYDDQVRNDKLALAESFRVVEPRNNSIIFFHAATMHEVTKVEVASKEFRDSRFTVNGWVHRV